MSKLIIYTDGGSRGNPGPAALGVVVYKQRLGDGNGWEFVKQYNEYLGEKTNNEAEYQAVVFALKKVKQLFGKNKTKEIDIEFRSDSELVVKQLNGEYKLKDPKSKDFFLEIWNLKIGYKNVIFKSIPREENKEADRLVNEVLDMNMDRKGETLF